MDINNNLRTGQFFNLKTFSDGSKRLEIKELNLVQRIIRVLGLGYKSTQSKVVSHFVFDKVKNLDTNDLSQFDWIEANHINNLKDTIRVFQQKVPRHQKKDEMVVIYDKLNIKNKLDDLYPIKLRTIHPVRHDHSICMPNLPYLVEEMKKIDTTTLDYFGIANCCYADPGSKIVANFFSEDQWKMMDKEKILFAYWILRDNPSQQLENVVNEKGSIDNFVDYIEFVADSKRIDEKDKKYIFNYFLSSIWLCWSQIPYDVRNKYFEINQGLKVLQ